LDVSEVGFSFYVCHARKAHVHFVVVRVGSSRILLLFAVIFFLLNVFFCCLVDVNVSVFVSPLTRERARAHKGEKELEWEC